VPVKNNIQYRLAPEELFRACDLDRFEFASTAGLKPFSTTIGQERALEAINFAVEMPHHSFNLYVMGSSGLGRHTLVQDALKVHAEKASRPNDYCYVANFKHPHTPLAIEVPAGTACNLRTDLQGLQKNLLTAIPAAFQENEYLRQHQEIMEEIASKKEIEANELEAQAVDHRVVLQRDASGFTLTPQKDGKTLTTKEFEQLPEIERQELQKSMDEMKQVVKASLGKVPQWQHEIQERMEVLFRETVALTVRQFIKNLEEKYREYRVVMQYLSALKTDIIENAELFQEQVINNRELLSSETPFLNKYTINILVDNSETQGAPIIFEDNPTYQNLIGRIEHVARMGTLQTDFTLIKAGAIHRANGGFLILDAEKVLSNPFAWDALKRVLNAREIRIQSLEQQMSLVSTISLEPQPIPIDLKVILVGSRELYYMLKEYDPEFVLLFKVLADFSEELTRDENNELLYSRLIATLQHREGLREIKKSGVARIIEYSARNSMDTGKLSLHMGSLLDLLHESDYLAKQRGSLVVEREDVQAAIDAQIRRVNQLQEDLQDEIVKGTLRIETEGLQLAQVNGLSVLTLGDYVFGMPTRITATARLGSGEVIDIERESDLSGQLHSKGVLILASYLGERYAKHQPLSLTASLVFEQSYSVVEGDSASAAELCALLSAIADVPVKQALAITGSINQHGQMQAIGGVCEKIEGYFELCSKRGLTGEQGVIIPQSNVRHLMLKQSVVDAVREQQFHIYAVDHVEQAMELLSGLPAGTADVDGVFTEGSFNHMVQFRLAEWLALRQHFSAPPAPEVAHE
jgi:lon-related putative ATP-dependent protease